MAGMLENAKAGAPVETAAPQEDLATPRISREADLNTPDSPMNAMRQLQNRVRPGEGSIAGGNTEEEASPEEQAEYERATAAMSKVIYEDERTSSAVAKQLTPEEKIGSVAKASMLVLTELDKKFNFDEIIIPQLTQDVVDRLIDMYEHLHEDEFQENEVQAALGAAWEGVMNIYGVEEEDYAELTAGMTDEEFQGHQTQYRQFLGEG